jgi:hypothetical protein
VRTAQNHFETNSFLRSGLLAAQSLLCAEVYHHLQVIHHLQVWRRALSCDDARSLLALAVRSLLALDLPSVGLCALATHRSIENCSHSPVPAMDENGAWKPMGEDWAQQQQHRSGFTHDEEFRGVGDGFGPGQSMPMEQMMQQRMGDFDGMRRVDPRALQNGPGGGGAVFYNGANSQPYPGGPGGAGVKDEMVRRPPFADMVRPGQEGGAQGLGSMHGSPNLANSLLNTNLGNYLTVLIPPVLSDLLTSCQAL